MHNATVTLQIPESLYQRLVNTANAVGRSLDDIMLQALTVGSPPDWHDVPEEFQTELAALDRLDNESLWKIAQSRQTLTEMKSYTLHIWRGTSNRDLAPMIQNNCRVWGTIGNRFQRPGDRLTKTSSTKAIAA